LPTFSRACRFRADIAAPITSANFNLLLIALLIWFNQSYI